MFPPSFSLQLIQNFGLAAQTAARMAQDDPVLLALQTSRRLPHSLQVRAGWALSHLPGVGFHALGAQLQGLDFPDDAQAKLDAPIDSAAGFVGGIARFQRRICVEVAISYGLVDWRDENLPLITRARAAWDTGAVSEAIALAQTAGADSYAQRLLSERELLTAPLSCFHVSETKRPSFLSSQGKPGRESLTAIHLLTNSLPATQSGYTLRSQRLLEAIGQRGIQVKAFTRLGYPVMIGVLTAQKSVRVGEVLYRRCLPWRLGSMHFVRLRQWIAATLATLHRNKVAQGGACVVHTTTNYPNAIAAQSIAQALRAPWVYEVRGIMEETWASNKKTAHSRADAESSERFALIRARETEMMQRADHVLTLSGVMKNLLVQRGIAAEKITVVPNAVSNSLFALNLSPVEARAQFNLPAEGFWVGSVSSLVDYEGFDTLLRAVALLRAKGQDARALLAGAGTARPGLEKLAVEIGLELGKTAVFLGKISPEQAYTAHQTLDVFAVPRKNVQVTRSVTPLKPIEAMALGRPIIVSDIPPLTELIHNSVSAPVGLLAEAQNPASFATAIERLAHNQQLYDELTLAGREFAQTRTWQHNGLVVEEVYRNLVKECLGE